MTDQELKLLLFAAESYDFVNKQSVVRSSFSRESIIEEKDDHIPCFTPEERDIIEELILNEGFGVSWTRDKNTLYIFTRHFMIYH